MRDRNKLMRIKYSNGVWLKGKTGVMNDICNFYANLYTIDPSNSIDRCIQVILNCICISTDMNGSPFALVTVKEVEHVVFSMGAHKASGPYGLNGLFFQKKLGHYQRGYCQYLYLCGR